MTEEYIRGITREDVKEMIKGLEELDKQIYVIEDHIVINVNNEYNIPLIGCSTPLGILRWVRHLTEKTWMTNKLMRRFIDVACKQSKIDVFM